jgi:hypothetical protein
VKDRPTKQLLPSISPRDRWRSAVLAGNARVYKVEGRVRKAVLKRDGNRCVYCGFGSETVTGILHIHHIDRDPSHNDLGNLETVCTMCHLILHAGFASQVLGILDLYGSSPYSQNEIIETTRRMRASGSTDQRIRKQLGLEDRRVFEPDVRYLAPLKGFISSRIPAHGAIGGSLEKIYEEERARRERSN